MKEKKISSKQLKANIKYNPNTHWTAFEKRIRPRPDSDLEELAEEAVRFCADNENVIKVAQWYLYKGICPDDWLSYCERNENVKRAHTQMLMIIGMRRELDAYHKKADSSTALLMMPKYDKDWKEIAEWRASLRKQEENKNEQKVVIIERFPETDQVPKLAKKD